MPLLFVFLYFAPCMTMGQSFSGNPVSKRPSPPVYQNGKKQFSYPWAGGMNACQFGSIDVDGDGKKDLFVFDRHGNRIMIFVNKGEQGVTDYEYAPEYASYFPELASWAVLIDYNGDGMEDIFTYSPGFAGIKVYRNTSSKELDFSLEVYPYLTSYQGGGNVNILVTDVDFPGLVDLDLDGDLDILTFWGLGSFVEMHRNRSVEKYGIPDSLDYIKTTNCWGYFAENEESNVLYLDTCINWPGCMDAGPLSLTGSFTEPGRDRHTGSTFLMLDLNDDQVQDLVLGDVDYPNLVALINGGTSDSAYMVSMDTLFPANTKNIWLYSFPLARYIDVDNNGVNDLIVAPFDPGLYNIENKQSSWLYMNWGTNSQPEFHHLKDDFLQEDMLDFGSGSCPVLYDYDNDGLSDLLVSNYGYYDTSYFLPGMLLKSEYTASLALLKNTGSSGDPAFNMISLDLGGLSSFGWSALSIAAGDLDGDNDMDMITGNEEGELYYFENLAGPGSVPEFEDPQLLVGIGDGAFLTPALYDLNDDGLLDLITGEKAGNLTYYRNTGSSQSFDFDHVTDSLGGVNVTDPGVSNFGYSAPCFFRNAQGETELLVGSEQGKIFYFRDVENNVGGEFQESDSLFSLIADGPLQIRPGIRTAVAIFDPDGDGYFDLIAGNFSGGLNYYSMSGLPGVSSLPEHNASGARLSLWPNPADDQVTITLTGTEIRDIVSIRLFNMYGKATESRYTEGNAEIRLFTGNLDPGIWFVEVSGTDTEGLFFTVSERLIKL